MLMSIPSNCRNPDSFAWLNSSRPAAPANCTKYNNWKYGLAGYKWNYNTALVKAGESAIKKNLAKKNVAYAHGLNDTGNDAAGCEQISQGANRAERFLNYLSAFPPTSDDTVDYYPGVGCVNHCLRFTSRSHGNSMFQT